jgi:hypothetical protein
MTTQRAGFLLLAVVALCEGKPPAALLPPWPPTWNMSLSTVVMPCDSNGVGPVPFPPSNAARWGIADFDWSNGFSWYAKQKPMNCEETLLAQAEATHALNSSTKIFVYRNAIKALPWFTLVREKLENKDTWNWFLPFKNCTEYQCGPNATHNLYHDFSQTPRGDCGNGVECGEYLFDLRVPAVQDWLAGEYILGPTGMGSPAVHGFYFDVSPVGTQKLGVRREPVPVLTSPLHFSIHPSGRMESIWSYRDVAGSN